MLRFALVSLINLSIKKLAFLVTSLAEHIRTNCRYGADSGSLQPMISLQVRHRKKNSVSEEFKFVLGDSIKDACVVRQCLELLGTDTIVDLP